MQSCNTYHKFEGLFFAGGYMKRRIAWQRGFLRLWAVFSILWLIVASLIIYDSYELATYSFAKYGEEANFFAAKVRLGLGAFFSISLPFVVLTLGFAIKWIAAGFQRTDGA
jgi:hypothetical protein